MLKILAPFNALDQIEPLIEAGANELYCGVVDTGWLSRGFCAEDINAEPSRGSSLESFDQLHQAVQLAGRSDVPIHVTLNTRFYAESQYPALKEAALNIEKSGAASIIVSVLGLILTLKAMGLSTAVTLSSSSGCLNKNGMLFFHSLGVKRLVFTILQDFETMMSMCEFLPELEKEVYILDSSCKYLESCCNNLHMAELVPPVKRNVYKLMKPFYFIDRLFTILRNLPKPIRSWLENQPRLSFMSPSMCTMSPEVMVQREGHPRKKLKGVEKPDFFNSHFFDQSTVCALCFLPKMKRCDVTSLKISGRGCSLSKKLKDVTLVHQAIDYLKTCAVEYEDFTAHMKKLFRETYGYPCEENCGFINRETRQNSA